MIPTLTVDADACQLGSTWAAAVAAPTRTTSAISAPASPIRRPRFMTYSPSANRNLTPDSGVRLRSLLQGVQAPRSGGAVAALVEHVDQQLVGVEDVLAREGPRPGGVARAQRRDD